MENKDIKAFTLTAQDHDYCKLIETSGKIQYNKSKNHKFISCLDVVLKFSLLKLIVYFNLLYTFFAKLRHINIEKTLSNVLKFYECHYDCRFYKLFLTRNILCFLQVNAKLSVI